MGWMVVKSCLEMMSLAVTTDNLETWVLEYALFEHFSY